MELLNWINRDIACTCGRTHRCDIGCVDIASGALARLPDHLKAYNHILLVADSNTYPLCGDRVRELLGDAIETACVFETFYDSHSVFYSDFFILVCICNNSVYEFTSKQVFKRIY